MSINVVPLYFNSGRSNVILPGALQSSHQLSSNNMCLVMLVRKRILGSQRYDATWINEVHVSRKFGGSSSWRFEGLCKPFRRAWGNKSHTQEKPAGHLRLSCHKKDKSHYCLLDDVIALQV